MKPKSSTLVRIVAAYLTKIHFNIIFGISLQKSDQLLMPLVFSRYFDVVTFTDMSAITGHRLPSLTFHCFIHLLHANSGIEDLEIGNKSFLHNRKFTKHISSHTIPR
jgi:hypothetical protein